MSILKDNNSSCTISELVDLTKLDQSAIMRAGLYLSSKNLAEIKEKKDVQLKILKEGINYAKDLLPELRLLSVLQSEKKISVLDLLKKSKIDAKEGQIALGWLIQRQWAYNIKAEKKLVISDEGKEIMRIGLILIVAMRRIDARPEIHP